MKIPLVLVDAERDEIVVDQAAIRAYHARLSLLGGAPEFLRTLADALERENSEARIKP
jgi:hypothetical protein